MVAGPRNNKMKSSDDAKTLLAGVPKDLRVIGYDKNGKPIYGEKDPEGLYSGGRKTIQA